MSIDPRTPVLVGVGAAIQREDDPEKAAEPLELMARALEAAAEDAGAPQLLSKLDAISAPRGFWAYGDPGRLLAERFGASATHTTVAEVGILQTTLFGEAARRIATGEADVVAVMGGEAKYRTLRTQILGVEETLTVQEGAVADRVLRPHDELYTPLEERLGLLMPVNPYAVMENALRHEQGLSIDAHRREIAEMWARMSQVAAANPRAWRREAIDADAIRLPSERNAMLAFPYTKLHNSQWNVDQAAGLIFCSAGAARTLGVAEDRWVFPQAVTESNHMVTLSRRARPERCAGARIAGTRALELSGAVAGDVAHLELYSCFPVAVRIQARELGFSLDQSLTETGGMAFAGGPLNNFVLQSLVRMAEVLRSDRGSLGLLTAVSGILTKQGFTTWSTEPPAQGFRFEDATDPVAAATETVEIDESFDGVARVAGYTVQYAGTEPARAIALCDGSDGSRALCTGADPALLRLATEDELCGRRVRVTGEEFELA
jgi:acetyl-CoA C-acetyltransferase